jgi:histidinol-phosphate aminotransferase
MRPTASFSLVKSRFFVLADRPNTIILRTISKTYGLAVIRVGRRYFPLHIAAQIRKLMNLENISAASQGAAPAAILDQEFKQGICAQTTVLRDRPARRCRSFGLNEPVNEVNSILIQFKTSENARSADEHLRRCGFLMRGMACYALPDCLHATIAAAQDIDSTLENPNDWCQQETQP